MTQQAKIKYLYQVVQELDGESHQLTHPNPDVVAVTDRCNDLNQQARDNGHGQKYRVETIEAPVVDELEIEMAYTRWDDSCKDPHLVPTADGTDFRECRRAKGHDGPHASGYHQGLIRW